MVEPEAEAKLSLLASVEPTVSLKRLVEVCFSQYRCAGQPELRAKVPLLAASPCKAAQQQQQQQQQQQLQLQLLLLQQRQRHWSTTRRTLHFFGARTGSGTPLNSLPSSLMSLSSLLALLLLLLLLLPVFRLSLGPQQASASKLPQQPGGGGSSGSGTRPLLARPSSALVANSIFDSILGRTASNEVNLSTLASGSIGATSGGISANSNSDNDSTGVSNSNSGGGGGSRNRNINSPSNSNENSAAQSNQLASQAAAAAADLHQSYKNGQTSDKVTLPGDILLGGLFPIHMKGTKVECGEINRDRGIQRLEAMLYALDKINEDSRLLPDIKLGAILLDSCSSSTYALNQSLEFIRASINTVESSAFECKDKSTPRPKYGSKMIAGVIGGSYSEVSLQVANLLRLFRIPQVSYASTGTALSDKTLYDLFARTVPSDMFQARAIADIVLKLNWSYVSLVSSEGLYGDSGSKEFMKQASVRRICIATHEKVSPTTDMNAYDSIIANLLKRNATGVVLFTRAEDTRELLLAVKRAQLFHNFTWVAADGWGTHQKLVEGVEDVALGAITVELQAKAIPGFDHYMKALTPWQNGRNPWFSEYWQEWFNCQLQHNLLQQQQLASGFGGPSLGAARRSDEPAGAWSTSEYLSSAELEAAPGQSSESDYGGESVATAAARRRRSQPNATSWPQAGPPDQTNRTGIGPMRRQAHGADVKEESHSKRRQERSLTLLQQQQQQSAKEMKQYCSPNLRISESNGYRQEQKVQFVVDAVYAMAHALHKAWFNLCDAQPGVVCEALKELNGGEFYSKYLLNVSFKDLAGSEVKFDEHGDGLGRYNIYNYRQVRPRRPKLDGTDTDTDNETDDEAGPAFGMAAPKQRHEADSPPESSSSSLWAATSVRKRQIGTGEPGAAQSNSAGGTGFSSDQVEHIFTSNNEFEYSTVGRWTESDYFLKLDDIQFIQGDSMIPESYCSRPCELGQAKIMRAGDHCCWICKTCAPFEFLPDEFSCKDCGVGRWPIQNKTSCYDLPQKYLRWDSIYSLISLTIACLGIGLTLFVSVIFIKYLDTPVVKASGRELSFILLAGIAFCHLSTFVLLAKPTTFICGSQRFLVNFGFSLMYASLLVKTNRISRIFNCARKSAKRPSFISPKSQMLITGILVAIQIFLTIVWFVFEPPGIRADSPEGKRDEVILKCRAKGKSFIISLVYNMILITTCTVYAVKTRKIPENFNESKFIGFTMYTTIVIWLAFVTMFFGTNNSYEIQINTMCVCISLSAYVTLFCLFSPKVSIILLHPDKNVRKLTMNSATYKRPFKQVSSHASLDGGKNGMNTHSMGTAAGAQGAYTATGSGGYIGPGGQTDGPSGGPMSTTSNMLNPVDSQAASRLQESSIVSNVVNSASAGSQSNCSQSKTPTTLSQQQLATTAVTCANCGAHQPITRQQPQQQQHQHQRQQPQHQHQLTSRQQPAIDQTSAALQRGRQAKVGPSKSAAGQQIGRPMGATAARAGQAQQQAKVLHSSRGGKSADDSQLLRATADDYESPTGGVSLMKKRQMVSLSRLNEIHAADGTAGGESSSSLANDSFNLINTSQENTPCNMPIGHAISKQAAGAAAMTASALAVANSAAGLDAELAGCGHYLSGKGSDSMLWNQSDYSIDYCSDCCPSSYCNCSCAVCLSSNGAAALDNSGVHQPSGQPTMCARNASASNVHASSAFGACCRVGGSVDYIYQTHPITARMTANQASHDGLDDDEPYANGHDQKESHDLLVHRRMLVDDEDDDNNNNNDEQDYDGLCKQGRHHHHQHHSNRNNNADEDGVRSRLARIRRRKSEEPTRCAAGPELELTGEVNFIAAANRQQHDTAVAFAQQRQKANNHRRRSQTMEMRTIHRDPDSSSSQASSGCDPKQRAPSGARSPDKAAPSIAFALQTAAHSALGACTSGAQLSGGSELRATTASAKTTSIKDKPSEKAGPKQLHQAQPTASSTSSLAATAGPIQASIELVKQVSHQMQQQQQFRNRKASSSYHDDYEYSYGLVDPPPPPPPLLMQGEPSEDSLDEQQPLADGSGRAIKLTTGAGTQRAARKGSKYEILDESNATDLAGYLANCDNEELVGTDHSADRDDDEYDDDNFEHDGRLSLNRSSVSSSSTTNTKRHSGSRPSRTKPSRAKGKQASKSNEGHRINSVTLIAATLSAGGAIVESGSGSSSSNKPPGSLDSTSQRKHKTEQRVAHLH